MHGDLTRIMETAQAAILERDRLKDTVADLLEALEALLLYAPKTHPRYPTQYQTDAHQARAAIAKAA